MTDATNPAAELDALVQAAEGVDPDAEAGTETEVQLDDEGNPVDPDQAATPPEDEDTEEAEYDGKKFKGPKGVKEALLRQADYTKKTQEVADQRRELEEGRKTLIQQAQAHRAMLADVAKVVGLNEQIAPFEKYTPEQWRAAHEADPDKTSGIWMQYQQLKSQRDAAATALQTKERARLDEEQRSERQAVEQRDAVLSRDIKGWNAETSGKLADFAEKEFGISKAEVAAVTDPRMLKVLHRAMANTQAQKTTDKAANIAKSQAATPAKSLPGSSTPVAKHPDKMTTDEWLAYERKRMAKKASR